ncbi:hypothetical protein PSTT_13672 [Puccinia striiformis]|uniref:Uncharacterized protein n=1 Tax=Puccinia striiformis TaxID=27350 RepID=A0A2S4UQJ7_9BASI|nr:hypothetical protein PSTT_13672 [Puccinia striiformis]
MTTPVEDFPTSEKNPDPSSSFKSPPSLSQPSPDDKSIVTTDLQSRLSNPAPPVESLAFVNMNSNERFHLPELTRINFLDWEGKVISVLRSKDLYDLVLDKEEKHRDEKGQFVAKEKDPIRIHRLNQAHAIIYTRIHSSLTAFGAAKKKANSFKAWYKLNHLELRTNNIAEFTSEYWNCIATLQSLDKVIEPASLGHALLAKIPASLSHVRDAIIAAGSSSELVVSHETVLDLLDSQLSAVIPDARPQTTSSLPRQSDPSEASALLTQKCPQAKQEAEAHLAMFVPPSTYNVEATQCQDNNDIDLVNSFQALSSKFTKDDSDDHQSEHYLRTSLLTINDQEAPTIITYHQRKDFNLSQSNKTIKSNLLDRITSTSQALYTSHKKRIVSLHLTFVRFTLNERHLSIPVSTSDHHERQDQLTKKFFMNINTSYSHTLDSIAKQITLP